MDGELDRVAYDDEHRVWRARYASSGQIPKDRQIGDGKITPGRVLGGHGFTSGEDNDVRLHILRLCNQTDLYAFIIKGIQEVDPQGQQSMLQRGFAMADQQQAIVRFEQLALEEMERERGADRAGSSKDCDAGRHLLKFLRDQKIVSLNLTEFTAARQPAPS